MPVKHPNGDAVEDRAINGGDQNTAPHKAVDVLSLLALVANVEMFWELGRVFQEIADQWNAYYVGNGVAFLVECLLLFLVFCVVACLEFYTPLAIGHSFAQHKMFCLWPSFSPSRW